MATAKRERERERERGEGRRSEGEAREGEEVREGKKGGVVGTRRKPTCIRARLFPWAPHAPEIAQARAYLLY